MTRFDRNRAVTAHTFVWQRNEADGWDRYLVREQGSGRGAMNVSRLTRVEPNVPVCLHCLSTNVDVLESDRYPDGECSCRDCGVKYGFVP